MVEAVSRTQEVGLKPPARLIASSWGAPQRGLYGPLGHADVGALAPVAEVKAVSARLWELLIQDLDG